LATRVATSGTFTPAPRMAFESAYNGVMPGKDPFIYGMGGLSLKF